jgi:uncharacterized oligopeptide transporter (OPT) family protein
MQDYKCAHIIGTTPRYLTYAQLIAAPIGAAAVSIAYPLYKNTYGVGVGKLSSPASVRIAGVAETLANGFDALPRSALIFLAIGVAVGIVLALGETRWKKWLPSPAGLGIGMMIPGNVVFTMLFGALALAAWERAHKPSADRIAMPLASGLIAGEAISAIVIAALVATKVLSP